VKILIVGVRYLCLIHVFQNLPWTKSRPNPKTSPCSVFDTTRQFVNVVIAFVVSRFSQHDLNASSLIFLATIFDELPF
jgi:hypothetical protein